ncbi:hypothetical protein BDZ97DRAFT_1759718 [Flammula alnicola]|nr:hypothetical protein BDZ97DRAFT_1759718 [Flammula alnicola]
MESGGVHYEEVESIWTPHEVWWSLYGVHMESGGVYMEPTWSPVESTWSPVESTWSPYKLQMDSIWSPQMTQLQLVDSDKTQKKISPKSLHSTIQDQVGYHQIQKFKEILDTHAPGYISMVLWELFAKKVALVSEKNAKYSTERNHETPVGPPGLLLDSI